MGPRNGKAGNGASGSTQNAIYAELDDWEAMVEGSESFGWSRASIHIRFAC